MKSTHKLIDDILAVGVISLDKDKQIICEGYSVQVTNIFAEAYRALKNYEKDLFIFQRKNTTTANEENK